LLFEHRLPNRVHHPVNSGIQALLVDDDTALTSELAEVLQNAGIGVTTAENAAEAIGIVDRHPELRIVVTDVVLGDISGLELVRKLSKLGPRRRIRSIILSGYSSADHILNALRLGVVDFLPKPVIPDELIEAVQRALMEDPAQQVSARRLSRTDAARLLLKAREKRDAIFGTDLLDDPAWNIMLDLYSSTLYGQSVTVSDLCVASGSPATTALRRLSDLARVGLVERVPDTADRRRILVRPTKAAQQAMDQFAEWFRDSLLSAQALKAPSARLGRS
jgi:CheY-like chemotaxis protein/DNA-binding MarR family transcriptional regulator